MRSEKNLADINRRVGFFRNIFNKGIGSVGNYGHITSMVFEERKPKVYFTDAHMEKNVKLYKKNDNRAYYTNHNIHNVTEIESNITFMKHEKSFTENQNVQNINMKSKNDVFNSLIRENNFISHLEKKIKKSQKNHELEKKVKYLMIESQKSFETLEHKSPNTVLMEQIKDLENNVVRKIEKRVEVKEEVKKIKIVTREERHIVQQQEKQLSNRIYTMVIKHWEKDKRRKGYLYD